MQELTAGTVGMIPFSSSSHQSVHTNFLHHYAQLNQILCHDIVFDARLCDDVNMQGHNTVLAKTGISNHPQVNHLP